MEGHGAVSEESNRGRCSRIRKAGSGGEVLWRRATGRRCCPINGRCSAADRTGSACAPGRSSHDRCKAAGRNARQKKEGRLLKFDGCDCSSCLTGEFHLQESEDRKSVV